MENYRKTSHSVYDIKYHVVRITKYRKPVLRKDVGRRLRELIRQVCTSMDIQILKGHVGRDHVHIMVSEMMKCIKGRTS
ncbi:MAG TPA: IS200/IS605 family transposase [Acidobacteriota bacterium]|nr:IS200/IS605 family transposase [Acidobacteriota bacterium]